MRWSASVVWSKMKQFNSELLNHNSWLERTPECYKQFFVGMQVSAIITWKNDMVCLYICSFSPSMLIPSQATVFFFLEFILRKNNEKTFTPSAIFVYSCSNGIPEQWDKDLQERKPTERNEETTNLAQMPHSLPLWQTITLIVYLPHTCAKVTGFGAVHHTAKLRRRCRRSPKLTKLTEMIQMHITFQS